MNKEVKSVVENAAENGRKLMGHEAAPESEPTLAELVLELFGMLESVEVSDSGREFKPTTIGTCRAVHGERLGEIMPQMKRLAENEVDQRA